jgi:hypothetical protein
MRRARAFLVAVVACAAPLVARAQSETITIEPLGRQDVRGPVAALRFSQRGDSVVVATARGRVLVLDAKGAGAGRELLKDGGSFTALARSRDDSRVALGTGRGEVKVLDIAGGAPRVTKVGETVTSLVFSPSGNVIVAGLENGEIALVATATGDVTGRLRGRHKEAVVNVAYLRDGETLVSVGADRDIVYWDVKKLDALRAVKETDATIMSAFATPSGDLLFVGTEEVQPPAFGRGQPFYKDGLRVYDMASAAPQKQVDLQSQAPAAIAPGPDCRHVAIVLRDKRGSTVGLFDVERGTRVYEAPAKGRVLAAAFASDGKTIALGTEEGNVQFLAVSGVRPTPRCVADLRGVKFAITSSREPLVRPSRRLNYAIMGMADRGVGPEIANALADQLLTRLARNPGVRLLERKRLDVIVKEQNLVKSGRIDPTTAVQLGRLFSVHKAILGSAARLGGTVTITVQQVDVATGAIDGTREVQCNACEDDDLGRAMGELATTLVAEPAPGTMAWPDPPHVTIEAPKDGAEVDGARLTVRGSAEYARALQALEVTVNGVKVDALKLLDPPTGKPLTLGGDTRAAAFVQDVTLSDGTNVIVVHAVGADGNDAQRILTVHRKGVGGTSKTPKPPKKSKKPL